MAITTLIRKPQKTYLYILLIGILSFSNTCDKWIGEDDKLELDKKPYAGDELRIEGYFYQKKGDLLYTIYFFYRNGTIRYVGENITLSEFEKKILEEDYIKNNNSKINWGLFNVHDTVIQFERWYPSSGGPTQAYIRSGIIINDTTFHITQSRRSNGSKTEPKDEFYHFKAFSPKPDSTNSYMK